jgi:hypothetical protein
MSNAVLERIEERALGLTGAPYIEELQLVRYMDNQTYEVCHSCIHIDLFLSIPPF